MSDNELQLQNTTDMTLDLARIEIDTKISTAKKYPRDIKTAIQNAITMATLNKEVAASCTYALPRKKKNEDGSYETVFIKGKSIRLAEIVFCCWKNLHIASRTIGRDSKVIKAEGICFDAENNSQSNIVIDRKITDKYGKLYNDDVILQTGNAAASIAVRNAILKVIPGAITDMVQEAANKFLSSDSSKDFNIRLLENIKKFEKYGILTHHILNMFNVKSIDDIDVNDLSNLIAVGVALRDGFIKAESIINDEPIDGEDEALTKGDQILSKVSKNKEKANG